MCNNLFCFVLLVFQYRDVIVDCIFLCYVDPVFVSLKNNEIPRLKREKEQN